MHLHVVKRDPQCPIEYGGPPSCCTQSPHQRPSYLTCTSIVQMFKGDPDRPAEYEGPRDEAGIVRYLRKQASSSPKDV